MLARKRFGQHFLVDPGAIADIVDAIDPQAADHLVEIGPGRAALTQALLSRLPRITALEIDRDLVKWLRARFSSERLALIEADALTVDFSSLSGTAGAQPIRLVGNLPYNISSPLLVHLIAHRLAIADQHFMLQKEVVERIVAPVGQSAYGRLSVLLQTYYQAQWLFDVGPASFDPPPRVTSSVLRMRAHRTGSAPSLVASLAPSLASIEKLTAQAFAQKRKMLRKTLVPWLEQQGLDASAIDPTARAEDVPVEVYGAIALQMDQLRSINSIL